MVKLMYYFFNFTDSDSLQSNINPTSNSRISIDNSRNNCWRFLPSRMGTRQNWMYSNWDRSDNSRYPYIGLLHLNLHHIILIIFQIRWKWNWSTPFLSFRLCINDNTVCTVHMPTIQLSAFPSDWRKDIVLFHSSENFISNPVVFIIPCLASTIWMGKVHPRSVRARVRIFYTFNTVFPYL